MKVPVSRGWATLVAIVYVAHAFDLARKNPLSNLLWSCNTATLLVGAGIALRRIRLVAIGTLLLLLGEPFWVIDLIAGGDIYVTSFLTHLGVTALGLWALRRTGVPRGIVAPGILIVAASTVVARYASPRTENINLAHFVPPQAGLAWLPHQLYLAGVFSALTGAGVVLEALLCRVLGAEPEPSAKSDRRSS